MRKNSILLAALIMLLLLIGCRGEQNDSGNMNVEFQTGIYYNKEWEQTAGTYQGDVIPNEEVAVKVAIQVFEGMKKSSKAQNYGPQSVFYDEQDEVWIVSFGEPSEEESVGGGCSIAIQKEDGKVLRIWYGE